MARPKYNGPDDCRAHLPPAFQFWRDKIARAIGQKHEIWLFVEEQRLGLVQDGAPPLGEASL